MKSDRADVTVTYVHLGDSANFPHQRSECVRHKFVPPPSWREKGCGPYEKNADFCNSCYCYLCDEEASKVCCAKHLFIILISVHVQSITNTYSKLRE